MPQRLTINNFLLTFQEFLITWFNQILYYNKIYEDLIYDEIKTFDLIVYKNRNPDLIKYLEQFTLDLINNLIINKNQENGLVKITCVIYEEQDPTKYIRSYNLKFHEFLVNLNDTIISLQQQENDTSAVINIPEINWLEINHRYKTILFLHIQELRKLKVDNNNELFFKILVDLDKSIYPNSQWVRLEPNSNSNTRQIPVGNLELNILNFDLHNEYY
ncbi:hypothetical protein JA1_005272 [Spathaspora sp. JA1]|nr:hypothetical protein JA1_005272 [Spathaspora sp. JA1]